MKKLLLTLFSTGVLLAAQAQSKDTLKQKAVDAICQCMDKQTNVTKENARAKMMECFTRDAGAEILALATGRDLELTSQQAMEELGRELATELFKQGCKSFVRLSVIMAEEKMKTSLENDVVEEGVKDIASGTATGTLVRVEDRDFRYLVVARDGQENTYTWLDYYPGSAELSGNKYRSLIGKKITVRWQEFDVYDAKANSYRTVRQIKGITINQ